MPAPDDDPPGALNRLFPDAVSSLSDGTPLKLGGPGSRGGYMGVYARVVEGGPVALGDEIKIILESDD